MKTGYGDITDKAGSPSWWDDNGVPRYGAFHPNMLNPYAREVALLVVSCQNCGMRFLVTETITSFDSIQKLSFSYGDPPNIGCCSSGSSMTTNTLEIKEHWIYNECKWEQKDVAVQDDRDD